MIVLAMTDCPPRLRGDISKWLCEINAGVYVGNVSARVREELWSRVCKNLKNGRATLVYSSNGEQKMEFRVHNTSWTPVDFDGITLMRRPLPQAAEPAEELKPGFSKAAKRQMAQRRSAASHQKRDCFVVIDLETTGLHPDRDEILEYGAKRVVNGETTETFSRLVRCGHALPQEIQNLTGITEELLQEQGVLPDQALEEFLEFLGTDKLIGYNISFDKNFLWAACKRAGHPLPLNPCMDLMQLARRKVYGVPNYKLETLAKHFSLPASISHRALEDCEQTLQLYRKLNETE